MKKSLRILIPLALLLMLFALALPTQADTLVEHTHNWAQSIVTKQPTCTEKGSRTYFCNCGERKTESIPALGHSWSAWKTTKAATCTAAGTQSRTCSRCGKTETKTIPAGHKWSAWKIVKKATCGEDGTSRRTCSVCKKTDTITIKATGKHKYGSWKVITPATCTEKGLRERVCSVCGQKQKQQIKALGGKHQWSDWKVTQAATCTEAGEESRSCSRCKDVQTRAIDPLGHDWDNGVTTVPAGYLETGVKTYTCARCGDTKTEEVPVNAPEDGSVMDYFRGNTGFSLMNNDLPLMIMQQPVGGSIDRDGGSMTLSVEATGGTPPYTYQWKKLTASGWLKAVWKEVKNSSENTLEVTDGYRFYYCTVYDKAGNHEDSDKVLVDWNLYISQQPENTSTCEMDPVILTCKAAGGVPSESGTYIYAWYTSAGEQISFSDQGATEVPGPGEYYCMVQDNGEGLVTSKMVTVYEADPFEAKTDAPEVSLKEGEAYELRAQVYGGIGSYTGLWLRDGQEIPTQQTAEGEYTAPILGDGSKEVIYTFLATDAMEDTDSCTVKVVYPQLKIAQQPQGGMLSEDGETPVEINVVMEEGEEPFKYYLYENDVQTIWGESGPSYGFSGWKSGEYYIHIEDAMGRWADSNVVVVTDFAFEIEQIYVDGPIVDSAGTTLKAVTSGGVEPITYTWWYRAEDGHYEQLARGYEPTCTAYRPGQYLCNAEDAEKHFDQKTAQVTYTGEAPIIIQQPASQILPYEEGRKYYSASLVCRAVAADGTTDSLEYVWQTKVPGEGGGWLSGTPSSDTYTMTAISDQGTWPFRCVVTDTRTGKQTISDEAMVSISLHGEITYVGGYAGKSEFTEIAYIITGGKAPYTVKIFADRKLESVHTNASTIMVNKMKPAKTISSLS